MGHRGPGEREPPAAGAPDPVPAVLRGPDPDRDRRGDRDLADARLSPARAEPGVPPRARGGGRAVLAREDPGLPGTLGDLDHGARRTFEERARAPTPSVGRELPEAPLELDRGSGPEQQVGGVPRSDHPWVSGSPASRGPTRPFRASDPIAGRWRWAGTGSRRIPNA